jgi:hypothetical protein
LNQLASKWKCDLAGIKEMNKFSKCKRLVGFTIIDHSPNARISKKYFKLKLSSWHIVIYFVLNNIRSQNYLVKLFRRPREAIISDITCTYYLGWVYF